MVKELGRIGEETAACWTSHNFLLCVTPQVIFQFVFTLCHHAATYNTCLSLFCVYSLQPCCNLQPMFILILCLLFATMLQPTTHVYPYFVFTLCNHVATYNPCLSLVCVYSLPPCCNLQPMFILSLCLLFATTLQPTTHVYP